MKRDRRAAICERVGVLHRSLEVRRRVLDARRLRARFGIGLALGLGLRIDDVLGRVFVGGVVGRARGDQREDQEGSHAPIVAALALVPVAMDSRRLSPMR